MLVRFNAVNPYIGLRPFTAFDAGRLGRRLSEIVADPANQHLAVDFPHLKDIYGSPQAAAETVRSRQSSMAQERAYAALAVMLGATEATARVYGVVSVGMASIPRLGSGRGPQTAIWLDANRPEYLMRIGRPLMRARIAWLLAQRAYTGRAWTVIRPENKGSLDVWTFSGYRLTFQAVGRPRSYGRLDGISTPRQLYMAAQPLESLR